MIKSPSFIIIFAFLINTVGPLPSAQAQEFRLPAPGVMVHLSPPLDPPILKGIKVHPDDPFRFDFILDKGDSASVIARREATKQSQQEQLKQESTKLIKYFLASLTIPEKDLWVNLSPYEKDRIIPQSFGLTEMGRDLLAEDYMLKQITASLIYPEDEIGKKFWKRIYEEAQKKFGTTNIPVNTFNKVWIVPDKAVVYENAKAGTAYVVESKLKVMLEQDYLALKKQLPLTPSLTKEGGNSKISPLFYKEGIKGSSQDVNALGSKIVREVVIPELTKEVNENKNFAQLRQVYNSLILASWYKKKIKDSILEQVYADKKKVAGVGYDNSVILSPSLRSRAGSAKDLKAPLDSSALPQNDINIRNDTELIYQRYLKAFKKGVFNYIKEEEILTPGLPSKEQGIFPRKYFSGGFNLALNLNQAMITVNKTSFLQNFALSVSLLFSVGCQILPYTTESQQFKTSQPIIVKKTVGIDQFWSDLQVTVGKTGEERLKSIVDFNNVQQISEEQKDFLKQLASCLSQAGGGKLEEWNNEGFEFFEHTAGLGNKHLSIAEAVDNENAYWQIINYFKNTPRPELEKYINIYQRLFMGPSNQNIMLRPDKLMRFLSVTINNQGKDIDFWQSVLKEFPQLFNPSIDYSRPFEQRTQDAVRKLNSLPPFSSVKDPHKKDYEAFNNEATRQLLRRYLLTILNFDQQAFPMDESRRFDALWVGLFADVNKDLGADSSGEIGYQLLTMRALVAILGHELGHNLDLLGQRDNNGILNEFVADTYAYLLEQDSGKDLSFRKTIQEMTNKKVNEIFFPRTLSFILNRQDPAHEEHYYARQQMLGLIKILGKDMDWETLHMALESMENDYQKGGLNQKVRDFIDFKGDATGVVYFNSFTEELLKRYCFLKNMSVPSTKSVNYHIKGGQSVKVIRTLDSAMTSEMVLPGVTYYERSNLEKNLVTDETKLKAGTRDNAQLVQFLTYLIDAENNIVLGPNKRSMAQYLEKLFLFSEALSRGGSSLEQSMNYFEYQLNSLRRVLVDPLSRNILMQLMKGNDHSLDKINDSELYWTLVGVLNEFDYYPEVEGFLKEQDLAKFKEDFTSENIFFDHISTPMADEDLQKATGYNQGGVIPKTKFLDPGDKMGFEDGWLGRARIYLPDGNQLAVRLMAGGRLFITDMTGNVRTIKDPKESFKTTTLNIINDQPVQVENNMPKSNILKIEYSIKEPTGPAFINRGTTPHTNNAMVSHKHNEGGIDLTPSNMNVETKVMDSELLRVSGMRTRFRGNDKVGDGNDKVGIKFHLDSAMLAQLQNAPGFVPVIISIRPMLDLKMFLGIQEKERV